MSHILHIIWGVVFSIIGIGFLGWFVFHGLKNSDDRAKMIFKLVISAVIITVTVFFVNSKMKHLSGDMMGDFGTALILAASIVISGISLSVIWAPHIGEFISGPLANIFDGGTQEIEPKPYYSIAHAKRKSNKPLEAIVAVREQLAKFPNDHEGVMMLATIQAEDMKDLPSAEMTLNKFCEREDAPPKQVAAALTQLADWHLKIANDVDSARAILRRIIEKLPDTELSTAAAQRLAHFGGTEEILAAARDRKAVFVPEGIKSAGLRDSIHDLVPEEIDAEKLAADLTKHLEAHPLDFDAREKLAIIYGRHYKRLDLAAEQLNQLIRQHGQSPKKVAHWLHLLADLQIRDGAEFEAVAPTLEKIIEIFPDLPVADMARSRLNYLKLEIKGKKDASENKKLGEYEQNIGIKYGEAYGSPRHL